MWRWLARCRDEEQEPSHVRTDFTSEATRIFVTEVLAFYTRRLATEGVAAGQRGAVVVIQPTSSDLKLNPHLHVVFLDGVYRAQREHVLFHELPHVRTRDVADVQTRATVRKPSTSAAATCSRRRTTRALGVAALAASATSGRTLRQVRQDRKSGSA